MASPPLQVSCLQSFENFTATMENDCSEPCYVLCPNVCHLDFSPDLITGYIFYTSKTPVCLAALYGGTVKYDGGSFTIRNAGELSQFSSAPSVIGQGSSKASNVTQPAWFIEPFVRIKFIEEPSDTTVLLGKRLLLYCKVNSRSSSGVTITWYNNKKEVQWAMNSVECRGTVCDIRSVRKSHAGLWQCKVQTKQSGTLLSRFSTVTVAYINDTFTYNPSDGKRAYTDEGGTLTKAASRLSWPLVLPCVIESQPPAFITWYKNNKVFNAKHVFKYMDGSLYFMSLEFGDTGSYMCTARNPVSGKTITSGTFWLQKVETAGRVGREPSTIVPSASYLDSQIVKPGEKVTLTCLVRGTPVPTITWSSDPAKNIRSSRVSTPMFARTLVIDNVQTSDEGTYICSALNENDYGRAATTSFKLIVLRTPLFDIFPLSERIVNKGDDIELRCKLVNRGSIQWFKDGKEVTLKKNKIEMKSHIDNLYIRKISQEDGGMYQCTASYMYEENFVTQTSSLISVNSKPNIITSGEDVSRESGQTIILRCEAEGFPYPYVIWYYDNKPLIFNDRISQIDVQTIKIENAGGLDNGLYSCVARNSLGSDSIERSLNVNTRAFTRSLTSRGDRGYYLKGRMIELTCDCGGTESLSISWMKDNHPISGRALIKESVILSRRYYTIKKSTLTISNADEIDNGPYKCKASNYLGSSAMEIKVRVFPQAIKPKLVMGPVNTVINEEKNMSVTCKFTGAPPPQVTWRYNGKVVQETPRLKAFYTDDGLTSSLVINDVSQSDSGNYSCRGRNEAGMSTESVLPITIYYTDGLTNSTNNNNISHIFLSFPIVIILLLCPL